MDDRTGRAIERVGAVALIVGAAAVAAQRWVGGSFLYTVWADRGLIRSGVPFGSLPTMGPELSYGVGARIPGGGFNLMLWGADHLTQDPLGVWRAQVTLDAVATLILGGVVAKHFGLLAGAIAAAGFLTADPNSANQVKLWNPAWMSLFVALAIGFWLRAVVDREARSVAALVVAVAMAAQMHVTAWLLLPALLPSVIFARIPSVSRGLAWGTAGAFGTFLPYLIMEAWSGWPNTRQLLHPTQVADAASVVSPDARPVQTVWEMVLSLAGEPSFHALVQSSSRWILVSGALAPLLVIGVLHQIGQPDNPHSAPRRRVVAGLLLALIVEGVAFARSRHFGFLDTDASRYLMAITPVATTLVGVASAGAMAAARSWGQIASSLVLALVLSSSAVRLAAMSVRTHQGEHGAMSWPRLPTWLGAARDLTGWSGADLAGRLVVTRAEGARWVREDATPVDAILGAGDGFQGSRPPPCAIVFNSRRPFKVADTLDDGVLAATLGPDVDRPTLDKRWDLMPGLALAIYHPASGRCPSTMSQRYVLTPDEQVIHDVSSTLAPHHAVRVDAPEGHTRWVAVLDASGGRDPEVRLPVMVDAVWSGDQLTATLTSNSLRGRAWNRGFYLDEEVVWPRLEIVAADGARAELVIEPGTVGGEGALTPLSATATVPVRGKLRLLVDLRQPSPNGAPPIPPVVAFVDLP